MGNNSEKAATIIIRENIVYMVKDYNHFPLVL